MNQQYYKKKKFTTTELPSYLFPYKAIAILMKHTQKHIQC
jgi:hypothetical protein